MKKCHNSSLLQTFQLLVNSAITIPEVSDSLDTDSEQFCLGSILTEQSHPLTSNLSEVTKKDLGEAISLLLDVDEEIFPVLEQHYTKGVFNKAVTAVVSSLQKGGNIYFCGCGATGRLSIYLESLWRGFWQKLKKHYPQIAKKIKFSSAFDSLEDRVFSVMAGGDHALIKSVEHFEDHTAFGVEQLKEMGVQEDDCVFSVTEGGETSFVIGTALHGAQSGAQVFFVYNNPDSVLCKIQRSMSVLQDSRIEKINLTTGPQAIAGSTRMQAATSETLFLGIVLEEALFLLLQDKLSSEELKTIGFSETGSTISSLLFKSKKSLTTIRHRKETIAQLIRLETATYHNAGNSNASREIQPTKGFVTYVAGEDSALVVLTDTTERSPTFFTPPFKKYDDKTSKSSPAYLMLEGVDNKEAWQNMLKRPLRGINWTQEKYRRITAIKDFSAPEITTESILKFIIGGKDVWNYRPNGLGNLTIGIAIDDEVTHLTNPASFLYKSLTMSKRQGAATALIIISDKQITLQIPGADELCLIETIDSDPFLLIQGIALKLLLNIVSTLCMVLLGRVTGNLMTYVAADNKKLVDRTARIVSHLSQISYLEAKKWVQLTNVMLKKNGRIKGDVPPPAYLACVSSSLLCEPQIALKIMNENGNDFEQTTHALKQITGECIRIIKEYFSNKTFSEINNCVSGFFEVYSHLKEEKIAETFISSEAVISHLEDNDFLGMYLTRYMFAQDVLFRTFCENWMHSEENTVADSD